MNQNFPFEDFFHQINDLLQIIADNADKPLKSEVPKDIEAKLAQLEEKVEEFKKLSNTYISSLGISEEDMQAYLKNAAISPSRTQKRIQERTDRLTEEIEKKKEFLQKEEEKRQQGNAKQQDISLSEMKHLEEKSPAARKSLFKRVGGRKNWRPL